MSQSCRNEGTNRTLRTCPLRCFDSCRSFNEVMASSSQWLSWMLVLYSNVNPVYSLLSFPCRLWSPSPSSPSALVMPFVWLPLLMNFLFFLRDLLSNLVIRRTSCAWILWLPRLDVTTLSRVSYILATNLLKTVHGQFLREEKER